MFPPPPARSQYSVLIRVTELVEPVFVLSPFLVSRVDLPEASNSKQQQASTHEMGENYVVLRIQPKFRRMIPMGVKDNHTKYEQETQRLQLGTDVPSGMPRFQKWPKNALLGVVWVPRMSIQGSICPHQLGPNIQSCLELGSLGFVHLRQDTPSSFLGSQSCPRP